MRASMTLRFRFPFLEKAFHKTENSLDRREIRAASCSAHTQTAGNVIKHNVYNTNTDMIDWLMRAQRNWGIFGN